MDAIDAQFIEILRRRLKYLKPADALDLDGNLKNLGLDSMASVDLLFELEDGFQVNFPDQFLLGDNFATARKLWTAVCAVRSGAS